MNTNFTQKSDKYFILNHTGVRLAVEKIQKQAEAVTNEDEYVAFVREWKQLYADVTGTTRAARQARISAKKNIEDSEIRFSAVSWAHSARQAIRPFGRTLSELRVEMKAKLKEGAFPAVEKVAEPA